MPNHGTPASTVEDTILSLHGKVDELYKNLVVRQQKNLPVIVNEYNSDGNSTTITLAPRSRGAVLIKGLLAQCTSNATITVGQHTIQITSASSPFSIGGLTWVINQSDKRIISQQSAGFLSLELFGGELGDVGVL